MTKIKINETMTLLMLKHKNYIAVLTKEVNTLTTLVQSMACQLVNYTDIEVSNQDVADLVSNKD